MDLESISENLSVKVSYDSSLLRSIINGMVNASDIKSYEDYKRLYKLRHDCIHYLICIERGLEFGEKSIDQVLGVIESKDDFFLKYWNQVKLQSPDIVIVVGNKIKMTEITISSSKSAESTKISKYSLLRKVLSSAGFEVENEVIVISPLILLIDKGLLMDNYKIGESTIQLMTKILNGFYQSFNTIHSTQNGQLWFLKFKNYEDIKIDFNLPQITNQDLFSSLGKFCFHDLKDMEEVIQTPQLSDKKVDVFLNHCANLAIETPSDLEENESLFKGVNMIIDYNNSNKNSGVEHRKPILPLPLFSGLMPQRNVRTDDDEIQLVCQYLMDSGDTILSKIGSMRMKYGKAPFDQDDKEIISLEGPNRKKHYKLGSVSHVKEKEKHKGVWFGLDDNPDEMIEKLSYVLSEHQIHNDVFSIDGPGLRYVKNCQEIYRELNLNSLRTIRRHTDILTPTNIPGVFLFIYRGAKLRTGLLPSVVWFRIIVSDKASYENINSFETLLPTYSKHGMVSASNWISVDANRLDHYLRCYDRILMSYLCYMNFTKETNLIETIKKDRSNTLGIIIMTYMENKRTTSKMLQDLRYLMMIRFSAYKYWVAICKRFMVPTRSRLQTYFLNKILKFLLSCKDSEMEYLKNIKTGKMTKDPFSQKLSSRYGSLLISHDRVLTTGPPINFEQLLCEMYFCMFFNKNQDDVTHSTFQILEKIIEGEDSFNEVLNSGSLLHTGLHEDYIEDATELVKRPHKNRFSRMAVMVGSILQTKHRCNETQGANHRIALVSKKLNKTLDHFATYKSSSTIDRVEEDFKKREETTNLDDLGRPIRDVNRRIRCIQGVMSLMNDGYMDSFSLVKDKLLKPLYFQIFKKNQIGGVREILILDIEKRALINVLESFSRVICQSDNREILTMGDQKVRMQKMIQEGLRQSPYPNMLLNLNFDKTKWGPSFMPIQFLYMFVPFKDQYPDFFRFILISLMVHSNKECLIPEELLRIWRKYPDKTHEGTDSYLQPYKEKYLLESKMTLKNVSSMGQGILHYTSSYAHICMLSLRDEIFKRACKKLNLTMPKFEDLVSSDDSYTALCLNMTTKKESKQLISLFLRAQTTAERLCNMWTSKAKSSVSFIVHEFNSLFGLGTGFFPTTLKFALSSVQPVSTDSFFRMTKECFNLSRQLYENGGSMELYMIAQKLNARYCEHLYHTLENDGNDPTIMIDVRRENVPYHLGVYPIGDPVIMLMMGPEWKNYEIMSKFESLTEKEKNLILNSFRINSDPDLQQISEMESIDTIYVSMNRIEINTGPIRKLQEIQKTIPISKDEIYDYCVRNPLFLIREPRNNYEIKLKVYLKLQQASAAEALRQTTYSILYGRMGATATAWAFGDRERPTTYLEELQKFCNTKPDNSIEHLLMYFPGLTEYGELIRSSKQAIRYNERNGLEARSLLYLQLDVQKHRITTPIRDLLAEFWENKDDKDHTNTSYRDWIMIKKIIPNIKDSIEETLSTFKGDPIQQFKSLILVILRLLGHLSKPMKAINFGRSTTDFRETYSVIKKHSFYSNLTCDEVEDEVKYEKIYNKHDRLFYLYDLFCLTGLFGGPEYFVQYRNIWRIDDEDIKEILIDTHRNHHIKKKILSMLYFFGYLHDLQSWSKQTHVIFHQWIKRQGSKGLYNNDLGVLNLIHGEIRMKIIHDKKLNEIVIHCNNTSNNVKVYECLSRAAELLNISLQTLINIAPRGLFQIVGKEVLPIGDGFDIKLDNNIPSMFVKDSIVKFSEKFITLINTDDGTEIMNCAIGLLPTNYQPNDYEIIPLRINGLEFEKIKRIPFLSQHFNFDYLSDEEISYLIGDNLNVPKPMVSKLTVDRLNLRSYRVYDDNERKFEVILEENEPDFSTLFTAEKIATYKPSEFFSLFRDPQMDDPDINEEEESYAQFEYVFDQNLLDIINRADFIKTLYNPTVLLRKVTGLKYHCISAQCCPASNLSREMIRAVKRMYGAENLIHSLIYSYDAHYTHQDMKSPRNEQINVKQIKKMLGLRVIQDDEEL